MATTKKEPEEKTVEEKPFDAKAYWNERVPFRAFRDNGKYKDDIIVGLNGKMYRIKRGVEVMIPRNVREIIYQSMEQDERTAQLIENETTTYIEESKKYE